MFGELGARVVDADVLVHQLYRPGEEVYQELVRRFGPEIVKPDGAIDRVRLAALAFDGGRVEELNQIVHPAVVRRQEQWMREIAGKDPHAVVMVEAALIFEAGLRDRFDRIIVVACPAEQKAGRLAQRTGRDEAWARAEVDRRSRAQLPDAEKMRRADLVIDNSGSVEATRQQVQRIFPGLAMLAQKD